VLVSFNTASLAVPASVWVAAAAGTGHGIHRGVVATDGGPTVGTVSATRVFRNGASGPWGMASVLELDATALTAAAASCYPTATPAASPALKVLDFGCFLNRFAAGDSYANCDQQHHAPGSERPGTSPAS